MEKRCPIKRFESYLLQEAIMDQQAMEKIQKDVEKEVELAIKFANESPAPLPESALTDVFYERSTI